MIGIANALVALVAALHVYFLVLEMFLWTKPLGLKTFGNSLEKANNSAVLAANQGLYNGFLAAGLVWGLVASIPAFAFEIKVFFLLCVIVAGVYGAVHRQPRNSAGAGSARGHRADPALAGVEPFPFRLNWNGGSASYLTRFLQANSVSAPGSSPGQAFAGKRFRIVYLSGRHRLALRYPFLQYP